MAKRVVEGRCLCMAIIFEYEGQPNWTLHCHCETCRRATSSPITTWISVQRTALRVKQGTMQYFNSSPGVKRGFCPVCGTPLTYENEEFPEEVHLYAVSLSDSSRVTPTAHVFMEEQLPWFEVADALPRFAKTRRGAQPIRFGAREL